MGEPAERDGDFSVRSNEISRIEGLSDAVFGFAITLLVVSLEVPKTSTEVLHAMRGFVPFALTFTVLVLIWRNQFRFFRRYGLEDTTTLFLNAALLFVVLFFVYPLKFVFGAVSERVLYHVGYGDPAAPNFFHDPNAPILLVAYGLGWGALFGIFALLYRHAYGMRDTLRLSPVELFDTREAMRVCTIVSVFGVVLALGNGLSRAYASAAAAIDITANVLIIACVLSLAVSRRKRRARRAGVLRGGAAASTTAAD